MARYDRLAAEYDRRWAAYNARSLALLDPLLRGKLGDVLDLACGTANLLPRLGDRAALYAGTDVSREMLRAARPKLAAASIPAAVVAADATRLPFPAASFDTVVCASALHGFPEPAAALAEARRVLCAGGRLLLLDWSRERMTMRALNAWLRLSGDPFRRMYTMAEAGALVEDAGFRVSHRERRAISWLWELWVLEASAA
jgi:ubiquinone/menaquinone biosynthesis C-methylase UbiE